MRATTLFSIGLGLGISTVQAAPAEMVPRADGISSSCSTLTFQDNWLIGTCSTGTGEDVRKTSIYLPGRIANKEGSLQWQESGNGNFHQTCTDCAFDASVASLTCKCRPSGGAAITTTISLEEHIFNYWGFLRYNFGNFPTVPLPSDVAVPASFRWTAGLSGADQCANANGVTWGGVNPVDCFALYLVAGRPTPFNSLLLKENPGYNITYFESADCSGTAAGQIGYTAALDCKQFEKTVNSFKVTPAWNADW